MSFPRRTFIIVLTLVASLAGTAVSFGKEVIPSCLIDGPQRDNACMYISETLNTEWTPRVAIYDAQSGDTIRCSARRCGSISFENRTVTVKPARGVVVTTGSIVTVKDGQYANHRVKRHRGRFTFVVTPAMGKLDGAWINLYVPRAAIPPRGPAGGSG